MEAEPRYNIRAVERLTGVPAPTLRSWERRYGFPAPSRTLTARRLYSDENVRAIRWVRAQTERGLSVAQAIEWAQAGGGSGTAGLGPGPPAEALVAGLVEAVQRYDETAVESALATAFTHYAADRVLIDVLTPALVEVGELWASGQLSVAGEHFFSNIVRRRLLALLAAQPALTPRLTAALACLPGEQHELGLLMLALFLRWAGAAVLYLGADLPVRDLIDLIAAHRTDAVCLSAGSEASWSELDLLVEGVQRAPHPPRIYLGGAAAGQHSAPSGVHVLTSPLPEAAATIVVGSTD